MSSERMLFDGRARYMIQVLGRIPESWSDRLEGMSISSQATDQGSTICSLEGELLDQAALAGVLNSIYEMHLPVLLVKCLTYQAANVE